MAAGEEDGSAVEPEQEPAAEEEQPRSFKDLVRLDGSRFCPGSGCPVPRSSVLPPPRGPCAAGRHVRRSAGPGAGLGHSCGHSAPLRLAWLLPSPLRSLPPLPSSCFNLTWCFLFSVRRELCVGREVPS